MMYALNKQEITVISGGDSESSSLLPTEMGLVGLGVGLVMTCGVTCLAGIVANAKWGNPSLCMSVTGLFCLMGCVGIVVPCYLAGMLLGAGIAES